MFFFVCFPEGIQILWCRLHKGPPPRPSALTAETKCQSHPQNFSTPAVNISPQPGRSATNGCGNPKKSTNLWKTLTLETFYTHTQNMTKSLFTRPKINELVNFWLNTSNFLSKFIFMHGFLCCNYPKNSSLFQKPTAPPSRWDQNRSANPSCLTATGLVLPIYPSGGILSIEIWQQRHFFWTSFTSRNQTPTHITWFYHQEFESTNQKDVFTNNSPTENWNFATKTDGF